MRTPTGRISSPTSRSACAGIAAVQGVVALRRRTAARAARRRRSTVPTTPRPNVLEAEVVLQVEVLQHGAGEQPEAERRERQHHASCSVRIWLSRANAASIEIGRLLVSLDDLAEHVLLLELAPRRLRDAEREERQRDRTGKPEQRGTAQRQPSSPPASAAMPPTIDRAEHAGQARPRRRSSGADAAADADRVGVGDQRALHRVGVRLRHADAEPGQEQR